MKEKFYYCRNNERRPIVTVCLLQTEDDISIGMSLCSSKDSPRKKVGRSIAKGRALKGFELRDNYCKINRKEAKEVFSTVTPIYFLPGSIKYKIRFNDNLSTYEQKLLGT